MGVSSIILYYAPVCHRMTLSALNLARPLAAFLEKGIQQYGDIS